MTSNRKRMDEVLEHAAGAAEHPGDREAEELRGIVDRLRALPRHEPRFDLAPAILARIAAEESDEEARAAVFPRIWLAAAAVLVLLLGAGLLLFKAHERHPPGNRVAILSASAEWLVNAQEKDGSWNPVRWGGRSEYTVALTGLAMMALAGPEGGGRNPAAEAACRRAAGYLVARQGGDGCFGPAIAGRLYNHGIATTALLKAAPAPDRPVAGSLDMALRFIASAQSPEGAWGYTGGITGADNTSITVWQVRALLEAKSAGRQGLEAPAGRAVRWLAARVDERGRFGYESSGDSGTESGSLTAMGASCVMDPRLGGGTEDLKARVRLALALPPEETGLADFYRDFFLVDALDKAGDREAAEMAEAVRKAMTARHECSIQRDGSWTPDGRWGQVGGKIYSTALATLSLDSRRRM